MKKTFALILLIVFPSAFAQTISQVGERQALDDLTKATTNLSVKNLSCQNDDECTNIEMGSKACGGPQFFLLASTLNLNYSVITYMAEQTITREREYNSRYEVISDCATPIEVTPRCFLNVCTY